MYVDIHSAQSSTDFVQVTVLQSTNFKGLSLCFVKTLSIEEKQNLWSRPSAQMNCQVTLIRVSSKQCKLGVLSGRQAMLK